MICIKIKSGEKSMIKIAICDDEKTMCEYLEQKVSEILKKWNIVFSIVCYTDALECFQSGCRTYCGQFQLFLLHQKQ